MMRVCFISDQIFHWGKYGGFGYIVRTLGRELVKRGLEVYAIVLRRKGQRVYEYLDGIHVIGYDSIKQLRRLIKEFNLINHVDIFHSEEPSSITWEIIKLCPNAKHVITFQDPRDIHDYSIEFSYACPDKWRNPIFRIRTKAWLLWEWYLIRKACLRADALFSQALFVIPKIIRIWRINRKIGFLPNPVSIPHRKLRKAPTPTVCFLGRWDPRKRVEWFFELAKRFPNVKFIAMGRAHDENRDKYLRNKYSKLKNVLMPGFVSEEEKSKYLEECWILILPSARECLPVAFLEALAHRCAILSQHNPDRLTTLAGYHVKNGTFKEYVYGLNYLLKQDRWLELGKRGFEHVKRVYELNKVIQLHINVYKRVLGHDY